MSLYLAEIKYAAHPHKANSETIRTLRLVEANNKTEAEEKIRPLVYNLMTETNDYYYLSMTVSSVIA